MQSNLRPFMCVGLAYFVIAVIVPLVLLSRGERGSWTSKGVLWSLLAGTAGALGALGVILALGFGGKPIYVMPLVFGGAPVVNTLLTAFMNRSFSQLKAPFLAGLILVITGAVTVLVFKPQPQPHAQPAAAAVAASAAAAKDDPAVEAASIDAVKTEVGKPATAEKKAERFLEVLLSITIAMFSWGAYGPVLHRGQAAMGGSRLRPLICIGAAYFLIAVLVPLGLLTPMGDTGTWDVSARSGASGQDRLGRWAPSARSSPSPAVGSRLR